VGRVADAADAGARAVVAGDAGRHRRAVRPAARARAAVAGERAGGGRAVGLRGEGRACAVETCAVLRRRVARLRTGRARARIGAARVRPAGAERRVRVARDTGLRVRRAAGGDGEAAGRAGLEEDLRAAARVVRVD